MYFFADKFVSDVRWIFIKDFDKWNVLYSLYIKNIFISKSYAMIQLVVIPRITHFAVHSYYKLAIGPTYTHSPP